MSESTPQATSDPSRPPQRKSRRRWWIALVVALAVILVVPLVGYQVLTSSWFLLSRVTPLLEERLGGEVSIGVIEYLGMGRVEIRDFRLRAPGVSGAGGEVVRVGRAELHLNPGRAWRGSLHVERIVLDDAHFRIAEYADQAGRFTFARLNPKWPDLERAAPPSIELPWAVVELGMYEEGASGGRYEPSGEQRLAGTMYPTTEMTHDYAFKLREIDERGSAVEDGILIVGSWDPTTFAHRAHIEGLVFDDRIKKMCPQVLRAWWEEMNLEGRLNDVLVQWDGENKFAVTFDIEDAGLKLPFGAEEDWVRFHEGRIIDRTHRPRMHVQKGQIHHEHDRLSFDLEGELIGDRTLDGREGDLAALPYRVSAKISEIPQLQWTDRAEWMEHVLDTVPFEMDFRMRDFRVALREDGTTPAVDLPHVIADMLQRFHLTDWRIGSRVTVQRGSPTRDAATDELAAAPIETLAHVRINDAAGMFDRFPYPLKGVEATVVFRSNAEENIVELRRLQGKGAGDVTIWVNGTLSPPGSDGEMNLRLHAVDMPVDERMRTALGGVYLNIFNDLLHIPSFESLAEAQALPDEKTLEAIEDELRDLYHLRRALRDDLQPEIAEDKRIELDEKKVAVAVEIEQLERRRAFGTFTLGGTVDLKLDIRREAGESGDPKLSGTIDIHSLGVLDRRFPYPFTITGGKLLWEPDLLTIVKDEDHPYGLPVRTPGGGHGFITGSVAQTVDEGGERRIMPELSIGIIEEQVTDMLLAAIPPSRMQRAELDDPDRWAGTISARSAELLRNVQLAGELVAQGSITTGDDLRSRHEFIITLDQARAVPTHELAQTIGAAGLVWPEGFAIRNLKGLLRVRRDAIQLLEIRGEHDTGTVEAEGELNLLAEPHHARLDVGFSDLTLGRYLVNLVPGENVTRAHELWDRYQPSGNFDAMLRYQAIGDQPEPMELYVKPQQTDVMLDGQRVTLLGAGGELRVKESTVEFRDLRLNMQRDDREDGKLRLRGTYGINEGDDILEVEGRWTDGRLDSPLIVEALRLIDAGDQVEQYREFDPAGRFNAEFHYASPRQNRNAVYRMSVRPSDLELTLRETRLHALLEDSARVVFRPGLIELHDVYGRLVARPDSLAAGNAEELSEEDTSQLFHLHGLIRIDEPLSMSLNVGFDGKLMDERIQAVMPLPARDLLRAIEFKDGGRTSISNASLRLDRYHETESGSPAWRTRFDGTIETSQAAMQPGIEITELDSAVHLTVEHQSNHPLRLKMDLFSERVRLMGRKMTNLSSTAIEVDETGQTLFIRDVRADSYGGALAAEGRIELGPVNAYEVRVDLVGLSLAEMLIDDRLQNGVTVANSAARDPHGRIYANMKLQGTQGLDHTRSGRGSVRAMGGNLEAVPMVLQLVHTMQLTVPLRGDFDHADVDFYVDGDRIVFERILIESTLGDIAPLQLFGQGEMDFNSFELNTRFRSRSGLLLVRDIAGGLSDQLYQIEITGTLRDPRASIIPLPGLTRGFLGRPDTASAAP